MHRIIVSAVGFVALLMSGQQVLAQQQPTPQPSSVTETAPTETVLKNEQLDALVAPQRILSQPRKKDGLHWPAAAGQEVTDKFPLR